MNSSPHNSVPKAAPVDGIINKIFVIKINYNLPNT
jgi:hypothetical protein